MTEEQNISQRDIAVIVGIVALICFAAYLLIDRQGTEEGDNNSPTEQHDTEETKE